MRKSQMSIFFLKNFATGILTPVLALLLLRHGATYATLSLLLGAYSLMVILAEFPSGLFADLYGRKKTFLLSAGLTALSYGILLFSHSFWAVLAAMVVNGLGRAFSSGSLDALVIDEVLREGSCPLAKVTGQINMLESAGLASGAIAGGLLAGIGDAYGGNVIVNLCLYLTLIPLTLIFIRERVDAPATQTDKGTGLRGMLGQAKESLGFMARRGTVRVLFLLAFATGFALLAVETYWQPAYTAMTSASWSLGIVSCAGFLAVIAGSKCVEMLLKKRNRGGEGIILVCAGLFGLGMIALFWQGHPPAFVAVYMVAYFFLGSGSVAQSTLLNREAPSSGRAGILSLFSFVLQIGGLVSSLCGYFVSAQAGYRYLWLIAGAVIVLTAGGCACMLKASAKTNVVAQPMENGE